MSFFSTTPNLPDHEKARIEFHLQQLAECVGFERLRLPVLSRETMLGQTTARATGDLLSGDKSQYSVEQLISLIGGHLGHDVAGVSVRTVPLPPEKSGGGG